MHPSLSVIFFTTLSGAGYGLLALIGVLAPLGAVPQEPRFGLVSLALALGLIAAGLVSSMFHLGRPERAWRALSQWRSSWLSREGLAAIVTFVPALLLAAAWTFSGVIPSIFGFLAAIGAAVTVFCTAMIYRSLKPIPRWHNCWVVPNYLAFALMTGSIWLALIAGFFEQQPLPRILALATIGTAAILKAGYWRHIDKPSTVASAESATGLGALGAVTVFEAPHTSENYLLKEMGFTIARKHAVKLRRLALVFGCLVPALLMGATFPLAGQAAMLLPLLAMPSMMLGIFIERWLFFAEARHVVTLYYGGQQA